ncbi:hypothetical protein [Magnetospirillum aberrantis]|uniref:Uncharacterized protein n=1 Tax=Magnetospirillum aberrantis SpK TaxID=908842 RepID=A0A7C9QW28_9PROT|nr:hypothetical protein [Magnetospirillum aberrantis]NFV81539.1 hypothetical protein [Magnetospirillum aberrantis SpK]
MAVLLRHRSDLPPDPTWTGWCAVAGTMPPPLATERRLRDEAARLEAAFDAMRDEWWTLGRALAAEPSGELGHMPTASVYASDTGIYLAWTRVVRDLAAAPETVLVVCDDPWVFRHLAGLPGVTAGTTPPLTRTEAKLAIRGVAARIAVAARVAAAWWKCRGQRANHRPGAPMLLVYGHPGSDANGKDAYFGPLLREIPDLCRLLHTDCRAGRAAQLSADGRTAALHAWGNPLWTLGLPFARWRPSAAARQGAHGWLVRRAAAIEGSGGSAAITRWQMRCQRAWAKATRPRVVAWPWENHPWERAFSRLGRALGFKTVGYQHTVVGPHMYNQAPATNPDGLDSLPELIVCNGPAYRDNLSAWGIPPERLAVGGTFRIAGPTPMRHDPAGPFFVGLSNEPRYNDQLMAAIIPLAAAGLRFVVKQHPMFPYDFQETETLRRTDVQLQNHDGLAGVVFCTGAIGLEGVLGGLPTFRFRPRGYVAMNVMPPNVRAVPVDAETLGAALNDARPPAAVAWDSVFAMPDPALWRRLFQGDMP